MTAEKAQVLGDWLNKAIAKADDDVSTLSNMLFHQRAHPNHGRFDDGIVIRDQVLCALSCCCNMISEQREKAIKDNEEKLELIKKRLDSLHSARAFEFGYFPELDRVFGVQCTFNFEGEFEIPPPIVRWSPSVRNLNGILQLDFFLALSQRTLIIRHNIFKDGKAFAFSSLELPHFQSIRVSRWPEIILFVFEHDGERRYLHFSQTGLSGGGPFSCFLK